MAERVGHFCGIAELAVGFKAEAARSRAQTVHYAFQLLIASLYRAEREMTLLPGTPSHPLNALSEKLPRCAVPLGKGPLQTVKTQMFSFSTASSSITWKSHSYGDLSPYQFNT